MSVKKIVTGHLARARSFADSVRGAYHDAYKKAVDVSRGSLVDLTKDIEPRIRSAVSDGLHGAQSALDDVNQSLADKAVPAFRKGAVSKEQLAQKARDVVKQVTSTTNKSYKQPSPKK